MLRFHHVRFSRLLKNGLYFNHRQVYSKPKIYLIRTISSKKTLENPIMNLKKEPFLSPFSPMISLRRMTTETMEKDAIVEEKDEPVPNSETEPIPEKKPENKEVEKGERVKHDFQAETKKILDIVARSLYTDREVFIRELISNASDAMEKIRYSTVNNQEISDPYLPLEINIWTDSNAKTIIIQDYGIGMNKDELIKNLGSIGHSGSLEFIKQNKTTDANAIIGQFGVGFYSSFMVAKEVIVYSKGADPNSVGYFWKSDGSGSYEISEAEGVTRGTKIIVQLNEKSSEFALREVVERIIKKYSNFVNFPILLNGKIVNTIKALWTMNKNEITEEQHKEFYQFISHAYDSPRFHFYYSIDSPVNIRGLFYIGQQHSEKFGLGKLESGVSLFSRRVLIQSKAKGILPEWLRFIKGVVDSEDIPLNISREHLQDSALIQRISNILTRRLLKWIYEEATKDPQEYKLFFDEFGNFFKEGICTDMSYKEDVAKLLRFESSKTEPEKVTSLEEYIERMTSTQKSILYIIAPNRALAEASPYFEGFKSSNKEVLFMYNQLDEFVMNSLNHFKGKKLLSVESTDARSEVEDVPPTQQERLDEDIIRPLIDWMRDVLVDKVSKIEITDRLVDSPAIIVNHESASVRRMMKYMDPQRTGEIAKQQMQINPRHPIYKGLATLKTSQPLTAKLIVEQIFDNALIGAGLMEDPRSMIPRLNRLLEKAIESNEN